MTKKISPLQKSLNLWALILIIWSIYRAKFHLPEWFDEFLAKPAVFILPVYLYIKNIEKKDFLSRVSLNKNNLKRDIFLSLFIGFLLIGASLVSNFLKRGFFTIPSYLTNPYTFFYTLIILLITALSEEILSRGFILKRLYEDSQNIYSSSFFASILFFSLHIPIFFTNPTVSRNLLLLLMSTNLILSLVNSFIFLDRKSLIVPILIHAFYNLAIIFYA